MQRGDKLELFVEKLLFEGAGLARYEGLPIFVDGAAPREKVLAEVVSVNKNFAKAKIVEIVEPSESRVKPFCAMANVCGGCCWQHVDYSEQLKQKKQIVEETVKKISGLEIEVRDVLPSPQTKEFRHKIQYPVSQTKVSKRLLAGYYKKNTHELVNIKHCPIQPSVIDDLVAFIREKSVELGVSGYNETKHTGTLRHVVFRHSEANGQILIVFVINGNKMEESVRKLARVVFEYYDKVIGCLVNFNTSKTNSIMGNVTQCVIGQDFYTEKLGEKVYRVSAGSFFQVNPQSALNILNIVKSMIREDVTSPEILDAYSGVGTFGIYLGDIAKSVTCVEDYPPATADAVENIKLNNYKNFDVLTGDAKIQLENLKKVGRTFDVVIVDPPRKGLAPEAVKTTTELSRNIIIYVSCNPSTLARDLKIFSELGYKADYIQPVDMFCHTFHIENVVKLKRV